MQVSRTTFGRFGQYVESLARDIPGLFRAKLAKAAKSVDHAAVIESVDGEGRLRASYLFMSVMASGIATIGLLVNSPAVIIGAMLISPLMAPLVRLGLGVGTLDYVRVRRALVVLATGMAFALATAMVIAWISPIQELTSEISARIRPSLFDLLVAIFSGLAGGYAMVTRRGSAIVGVAIATALMPPMAVVGYGVVTWQWTVVNGALLLFVTNLVAIALSVTAVTTWYGFSRRQVRQALVWQTGLGILLLLPLAFPLFHSLRAIAHETQVAQVVRRSVDAVFGASDGRVLSLHVVNGEDGRATRIDLAIATRHYTLGDDRQLRKEIGRAMQGKYELHLSPIIQADPARAALENALRPTAVVAGASAPVADPIDALLRNFPIRLAATSVDKSRHDMVLYVAADALDLAACRDMETNLRQRFARWTITIVPPVQALPPILFRNGQATLDADNQAPLQLAEWALDRWNVHSVKVFGLASSEGRGNARLARQRAAVIAERLSKDGIVATPMLAYQQPGQSSSEKLSGRTAFRSAVVVPGDSDAPHRTMNLR